MSSDHLLHRRSARSGTAGAAILLLLSSPCLTAAQSTPGDSARAAMQQRMMRWVFPGEEHARLGQLAGSWRITTTLPGAPGRAPTIMSGTANARSSVGGRFLTIESRAEGGGQSIDALTILGFDGRRNEFTYVGHDSFGTYFVTARGAGSLARGSVELSGIDQESARSTKHFTILLTAPTPDLFTISIQFQAPGGGAFTVLESAYQRMANR